MSETKLSISNDLMLETAYAFNQISTLADELATNVSEIGLSEEDKKLPVEVMPKNRYSNMLYLLADYTKLLDQKITKAIVEAGGNI